MTEEFRELEDFPGYKIGNMGTIVGTKFQIPLKQRKCYMTETYYRMRVNVTNKDGIKCFKSVHRLVALAWIPNPDNKPQIDHIDRNPGNNCIENLRWSSSMDNNNNLGLFKTNTSGVTGLIYGKSNQRWYVNKTIMGVKYQKSFKERSDAEAYLKQVIETPRFLTE